jgi:hypothetical protein
MSTEHHEDSHSSHQTQEPESLTPVIHADHTPEIHMAQPALEPIDISPYTKAFVHQLESIKKRVIPHEVSKITVSQTVSFLAFAYEKVRNAVEFREDHLVRRAAIERILKRRLILKPDGKDEGENLIRELLWARYLPNNSVTHNDVAIIQETINKYLYFRTKVLTGRTKEVQTELSRFIIDLMTCELEENLNPESTQTKSAYLYFFYQTLKNKIEIKNVPDQEKDTYFYVACEIAFAKNDLPYMRYHMYKLLHAPISQLSMDEIDELVPKFPQIVKKVDETINNPYKEKIIRFVKKQTPPFLILFTIADKYKTELQKTLTDPNELWEKVDIICREVYTATKKKIRTAAIRSIIYIFITKSAFVLILEYPVTLYLYGAVHMTPLIINTLFPPFLMAAIITFVSTPNEKNTKLIYSRIRDILTKDPEHIEIKNMIYKENRVKRPILLFGFTIFYLLTYAVTFALIYYGLGLLNFNIINKAVFIFFISIVTFFAYRIRQTAKEYSVEDKPGILSPIVDFFMIPVLSVGKFLSSEIGKLNVFILIFDFLIEAPFKLIFEIVEEWINFVKTKKDEIM